MTASSPAANPSPTEVGDLAGAQRTATAVGVISTVLGGVLLLAPATTAGILGIRPDRGLEVIGAVDVVVGAGLLTARNRAPWLYARAAANPPTAAWFLRAGLRDRSRTAVIAAVALGALTVADARTAGKLSR